MYQDLDVNLISRVDRERFAVVDDMAGRDNLRAYLDWVWGCREAEMNLMNELRRQGWQRLRSEASRVLDT